MASNNSQIPPQQFYQVDKSSSDQLIQPNPNSIAQQKKHLLDRYWNYQRGQMAAKNHDFKKHEFPLSRIKNIMKFDEDVQMVSPEVPILFAKACEFFVQELTIKSWLHAEHCGRRTLSKGDILEAVNETDYYDFLFELRSKEQIGGGSSSMVSSHADSVPTLTLSEDGVMVLPPSVQRWIRYGDDDEMNGGEQMNDVEGAARYGV